MHVRQSLLKVKADDRWSLYAHLRKLVKLYGTEE